MTHLAALLFDLGDILMIEESEVKDEEGTTLRADLLPGAAEALNLFRQRGYKLALVADSRPYGKAIATRTVLAMTVLPARTTGTAHVL